MPGDHALITLPAPGAVRCCPRPPGCVGQRTGQKGPIEPLSVEGSSRIRGEVTDTLICILGSSQDEMTMLASGSEVTWYLTSVTIFEVQTQHKAASLQLRGRCKQHGCGQGGGPCQAPGASMGLTHSPALQERTHVGLHTDNGLCI